MPKPKSTPDVVQTGELASASEMNQQYETFMSQLLEVVPPVFNARVYDMYKLAWDLAKDDFETGGVDATDEECFDKALSVFQLFLGEVPKWDDDRIAEETEAIIKKLPWLRGVMRQMLVARVYVLMKVRNDRITRANYAFEMPSDNVIVHTIFKKAAKRLRGKAVLYRHPPLVDEIEYIDNTQAAEDIIAKCFKSAIPALVPIEDVINAHLVNPPDEPEEQPEEQPEETEPDEDSDAVEEKLSKSVESDNDGGEIVMDADEPMQEEYQSDASEHEDAYVKTKEESDDGENKEYPLDPSDVPADRTAAETALMLGDSEKTIKLKKKATKLAELIERLREKRAKVPSRHKTVIAALDDEIADREAQYNRTRSKLKKK